MIEKAGSEEDGIVGIDPEAGTICDSDCKEYRYTGSTVKNYVKLRNIKPETVDNDEPEMQDELWRIIGVFTDEETDEKYMRIVRDEMLPESYLPEDYFVINENWYRIKKSNELVYWNYLTGGKRDKNDWSTAGLQYYLNTEQDDDGSNKGYISYLSEETKSLLNDRTHYLGTFMDRTDTTVGAYLHERDVKSCVDNKGTTSDSSSFPVSGCNVWDENAATWKGSISLMYPSDYGYSADKQYWTETALLNYDEDVKDTSWVYTTMKDIQNNNSWLLSPRNYDTAATILGAGGYISGGPVSNYSGGSVAVARPVLNLKSDVKITNFDTADGSMDKPYELGL